MLRLTSSGVAVLFVALVALAWPPPPPNAVTVNGRTFLLPAGFTIELAVKPGLVDRPITIDLDEAGRLYVADASGTNDPVAKQLAARPHRIVRLEDADGDGVYDRRTVFADKMMLPEGTLWYDGSLYVATPPSIWKLTDTKGTGVADKREEWFAGKTLTGCANDLHGPYLGLDGRIYWTKGAFAQQTYKRPGKKDFVTSAAHIFRARPDGRDLEPVMTGGMDNPVDVVFTPEGERLFTTTFLQHPAGGRRDGLLHAIPGGIHGKDHAVIRDPAHAWTGPSLLPVMTHLGPAAPAGLHRLESSRLAAEYRNNLFAAEFNMHKISRHVLVESGSTYTTRDEDFLVCTSRDFHPTDLIEDADGSLLVVDTGGWYKLCCPTSQLGKPDILGAIYRVRRTDAPAIADPRGLRISWGRLNESALVALLADERPFVVRRAMHEIGKRGYRALGELTKLLASSRASTVRQNVVWAATRIDDAGARRLVRSALRDADANVRQAALNSVSLWRDAKASVRLTALLAGESAPNRRVAAEALGRIGDAKAVPALLAAKGNDRPLDHAIVYALIEIGDRAATEPGLKSADPVTRRAALIALDQMPGSILPGDALRDALASGDSTLREAAWWIAGRRPAHAEAVIPLFAKRLADESLTATEQGELTDNLSRLAGSKAIQSLLAGRLADPKSSATEKRRALGSMAGSSIRPVPDTWTLALKLALAQEAIRRDVLTTIRALPLDAKSGLTPALVALADDARGTDEMRLLALASVPGGPTTLSEGQFRLATTHLDGGQTVVVRGLAANILSKSKLSPAQLTELTNAFRTAGPMELDRVLDAYAAGSNDEVGGKLIAALSSAPARGSLRVDSVRTRLAKFSPGVKKKADKLYAELDADAAGQKTRLDKMLASLGAGDVRRGQEVFHSEKAACFSCHAIGYRGGNIGPDLTRIGGIRDTRDLLESIVYPSASFVRSYEPVIITTTAGKVHSGNVRKETPEEVVIATSATEEVRIPRTRIEAMAPGKVSIMPSGMDKVLTPRELADLVAFLKACK
jgi:putative membrane-bound dehydrogenase-like protein